MLKNYFKIAVRQLQKQKLYAAVKIGGFALSIAACLLIALYIRHEVSYDKYYPDADRIYRVVGEMSDNGVVNKGCSFPAPFAGAMKQQFPEIELAPRLMPSNLFTGAGSNQLRPAGRAENTYEEGFTYADPQLLEMFSIPMVYGDRAHALDEPNTIVISKRKADKYFPGENPVGKMLILNDDGKKPYRIGGVMEDIPTNSHLHGFDFLLTLKGHELWPGEQTTWGASNYENYIMVRPGTDIARLETRMLDYTVNEFYIPLLKQEGSKNLERLGKSLHLRLHLQPVGDIRLYSQGIDDSRSHGDIRFIWLFGAIAVFILIIACINFINLSTAKSANRAKEVGLKKAIGAFRSSLVQQFLAESLLYSVLSFIIGLLLAWLLLPYFNSLAGKSLSVPWTAWWLAPLFLASAVLIGLLAGLYPSFYLSAFRPMAVLKGHLSRGSRNANLRSVLVVFQFTTSVILIIGTFVIYRQMQFILNRKLGFDKDQVLMIQGAQTLGGQVRAFKEELRRLPQVKSVAVSDFLPVSGTKRNGNTFWKEGRQREDIGVPCQKWDIDHDYIRTMGMKIVAGRNFSPDMPSDSQAIILNQAMARKLFPNGENPVGQRITNYGTYEVIGVVADFNFESMRTHIEPLCMTLGNSPTIVAVKVGGTDMQGAIKAVTGVWKNFAAHQPFRYTFLDERFAQMYADVRRMGRIFTSFAVLAIIVACLGLFALSAFMAEQRSKEVSIRKVLGASVAQVTTLISKDFVKLVLIAVLLATPVAWWAMNQWLQDFAYRAEISWWMFPVTGLLVVLIALVTISFQSIKAAVANPVERLRAE
ncbi:ABC transporter permease [Chitinophaga japonensis]|uniref:Putative ABC transport system permease protein n=1 Tax=Chitinophaga japonensis TaxID=104662 RepID=A0A562T7N8_CHIJA|nr:ABC transporter permease [Chitinophaga japonensis]TWI89303.1 putative ABC transport system permease protein [Chitinophaga japonensis]